MQVHLFLRLAFFTCDSKMQRKAGFTDVAKLVESIGMNTEDMKEDSDEK